MTGRSSALLAPNSSVYTSMSFFQPGMIRVPPSHLIFE